ncbi:hypothetical protein [Candidatus Methylomicrobium oryzae]|jgi:hypothetical protein|uniref:hypothetical protein n=1 Tax=Candidatus Methylomicrobium oryzae TaxID=2802053 RepID=UPI0019205E6F|nr:hypothetical protein [Methylomicrobium sp. RS1]MBL1264939.1 hypothetical protein [Methylomicrobium sp. RS1]
MSIKTRRSHSSIFKAKAAMAALAGDKPLAQLVKEFELSEPDYRMSIDPPCGGKRLVTE